MVNRNTVSSRVITGLIGFGMLLAVSGCALKSDEGPPMISLNVTSDPASNEGHSFFIVARSVDTQVFLTESYQEISEKLFASPPDQSVLGYAAILPGKTQKIEVVKPEGYSLGIYCLFTNPSDKWKIMLSPPIHPHYSISVKENKIITTERIIHQRKGLLQRLFSEDQDGKKE